MECTHARLLMTAALGGDTTAEEVEALRAHIRSCSVCTAEAEGFARTWDALATLSDTEIPGPVWGRIQAHLPATQATMWWKPWPVVGSTAALGLLVSLLASLLLPYERLVRLCSEGVRGLFDTSLPDPALFFGVGFLYGLLPLGFAALALARRLPRGKGHQGVAAGAAFSILVGPYILIACGGLPGASTAGLFGGIVAGALAGGPGGMWAGSKLLAPLPT